MRSSLTTVASSSHHIIILLSQIVLSDTQSELNHFNEKVALSRRNAFNPCWALIAYRNKLGPTFQKPNRGFSQRDRT